MNPDVTVVVVSWNTREHLSRCLDALEAAADGLRVETVVVDTASTDGSPAMVREKFPRVRLIQSPDNVGFGRASNVGAAAGAGRAILLLNSDCEVAPRALAALLGALNTDPTLGAVFARLVNTDGTLQPSVHDALPTPWSQAAEVLFASSLKRALMAGVRRRHAAAHDVAWGGAACLLVRRTAFEAIGGFDPRFFMSMEDVDLCARLGAAGFRLRYLSDAVAVHHCGASTARRPRAMLRHAYLSRIAYFDKHFPGWGGGVASALISLELAVSTTTFAVAARLTRAVGLRAHAEASAACHAAVVAAPRSRVGVGVIALIVALVLARYAGDVLRIARDSPAIDFAHYYTYALVVTQGHDPFDPVAVENVAHGLGIRRGGSPVIYLPSFYVLMGPWTWLPFWASALTWLAFGQVLFVATIPFLLWRRAVEPWRLVAALVLVAMYQPLFEAIALGQVTLVLFFLLTLGWWAIPAGRPWLAATALAAALHVKPQFGLMIPVLWWIGQRAVALRAAAVSAAGFALSVALVGLAPHVAWARQVFPMADYLHGWTYNHSVHAALHRLLDGRVGTGVVEVAALAAAAGILTLAARAMRPAPDPGTPAFDWAFGLGLTTAVLVSPLTEEQHFVILLLPLVLLVMTPETRSRDRVVLIASAVLIGARYSLERVPAVHAGLLSLLMTGKLAGVALLAWLLARRLRETAR